MSQTPASREDIRAFAETARGVTDRLVTLNLGPVTHTGLILLKTGFDLSGFQRILDNYGVRHILKQHGSPSSETRRGQIAVTLDDFGWIPLITSQPDNLFHDGRNRIGRDVLVFTRAIDGIGYRYVEEIRSRGRLVATDSLRKKKGPWGP